MQQQKHIACFMAIGVMLSVLFVFSAESAVHAQEPLASRYQSQQPKSVQIGRLALSAIYTDSYEINDSQSSAANIGSYGQIPCSGGVPVVGNATFYRVGLSTPATDQDWYKLTLEGTSFYTISVSPQAVNDLQFNVSIYDPSNNQIASRQITATPVISFYTSSGGTYYFSLSAANSAILTGSEDKPYQIALCSSIVNSPVYQDEWDANEPNDTISEAAISTGSRTLPSFIAAGTVITGLNFYPYVDRTIDAADWFEFYGHDGSWYQVTTLDVKPGVETVVSIYYPVTDTVNPNLSLAPAYPGTTNPNNRYITGKRGSRVMIRVPSGASGLYWIMVTNTDPLPRVSGQTYSLAVEEVLLPELTPRVFIPVVSR